MAKLDLNNIPFDDKAAWDLICSGRTKGMFQIESPLGKTWCMRIKPRTIEELSDIIALIRPGCLNSFSGEPRKSTTQHYTDRKNKAEEIKPYHPVVDEILKPTQHCIIYQESSILLASKVAGFTEEEADSLRKAIGKKLPELMAKVEKQFIEGCEKTGVVTKEQGEEIFGWIKASQRYAFNKSHSVAYAVNAYRSAYCKAHYPLEFFCSYISKAHLKQDPHEEIRELGNDAKSFGISLLPPDFRANNLNVHIVDGSLRFGIANIKNLGESSLSKIVLYKDECVKILNKLVEEWSWLDYLIVFSDRISSTSNIHLISCGALDYFSKSRSAMIYEYNIWNKLTDKEKDWIKLNYTSVSKMVFTQILEKCVESGCSNKKRREIVISLIQSLQTPPHSLEDTADWLSWSENKYLGIAITCSKIDDREEALNANCTCADIINGQRGYMLVACEIVSAREIKIKNGNMIGRSMCFLVVSDNTGHLENIVCFPDSYDMYKYLIYIGNTVLLQLEKGNRKDSLVVKKCIQI